MEPTDHRTEQPDTDLVCGVDIGASATKLVLLNRAGDVVSRVVRPSGVDYRATARACLQEGLENAGVGAHVTHTVSTGYGRRNVDFSGRSVTEIHCHGVGSFHLSGGPATVIDIGGQDNKVIRIDAQGKRVDFRMNRKCAAGTGAFLEEIALRLDLPLARLDGLARAAKETARLSSFCTVFAKTEVLAHLRAGVPVESIVRGAYESVVSRALEMAPLEGRVVLTGGVVAHHPTVASLLSERVGMDVFVPPHAQHVGALGAALLALLDASNPSDSPSPTPKGAIVQPAGKESP
jgi:predicted CoA-substrate-specific enzyme activase